MSIASLSIKRPVLTIVSSLAIVILGTLSISRLGVREFPKVDTPVVSISASYPGASAEVIESQITEPIEAAVNAVAGIRAITSSSREGSSNITVDFDLSVDIETAANDIRDKLGSAVRNLPVDANPPVVTKADADAQPIFGVFVSSKTRDMMSLTAYADTVLEQLQTIPGVSNINMQGDKRYSMRLWMEPSRLAAYNLTPLDVRQALQRENLELPSGRIEGGQVELSVRTLSRLSTPEQFNNVVIKRSGDQVVRFSDVGYAELAPQNLRNTVKVKDDLLVALYVTPQPGANQIEIADRVRERIERLQKECPADVKLEAAFDNTDFVRMAILEVTETMGIAFVLVLVVIFLFLRDWRSTLIPVVAIPVSIIGTFLIMDLAGFSINVLTLLGLVLAIGLVVDDAIVVLENIYAKIEKGVAPIEAGIEGTKEIFVAIISTTLALAAVFLPVMFLGGVTGRLFREFGVVIAGSVIISAFVALTLTPMLSVKLLRAHTHHNWFYRVTEPFYVGLNRFYDKSLAGFLKMPWLAPILLAVAVGICVYVPGKLPRELSPLEDRGRLTVRATGPEGASYDYMVANMDDLIKVVNSTVGDAVSISIAQTPVGGGGGGTVNSGSIRMFLKDKDKRLSQQELAARLQGAIRSISGLRAAVAQDPSIGDRRSGGLSAQLVIQAAELEDLQKVVEPFIEKARKNPAFSFVDSDLKFNRPELRVAIQRDKAQTLGVTAADISSTLQAALSGQRFGYFIREGKQYDVIGQLLREDRSKTSDLGAINVRTTSGEMVPLDNLITPTETSGPPQLFRYNRYVAATISGTLSPGYTLGQGVIAMRAIAKETLDDRYSTSLTGAARDFEDSSSSLLYVFALALLFVYLILAAQFESFKDPFTIMLTVPLALAGALLTLWAFKQTLNIYSQIGLIMLIGLVTKNGILLVEFATQRQNDGLSAFDAIKEAAASRFRPILMTSFCTVLGTLPIALALGAGAESRVSMGLGVIGGLLAGTALTLFVIPAIYIIVARRQPAKVVAPVLGAAPQPAKS